MNKKGESKSASGAVVLILLIAVFILVYMLFIPSEDRQALLNQTDEIEFSGGETLLTAFPGEVVGDGEIKHEIMPVLLFIKDKPETQVLAKNLEIKKGLFDTKEHILDFKVNNLDEVKQSSLFFYVVESDGRFQVELNGEKIFDNKIEPQKIERVVLPLENLKEENKVKISVSRGILSPNKYLIENVEIRNNFEVQNTQEIRHVDIETPIDSAELRYNLFYNTPDKTSTLTIYANNKMQAEKLLPTGGVQTIEIDEDVVVGGQNSLTFEIDRGEVQLSNIVLVTKSDREGEWESSFRLEDLDYDNIVSEEKEVILQMQFEDSKTKTGRILINGREIEFDTEENEFETFISSYVKKGKNEIKIQPEKSFKISRLTIKFE